MQIEMRALESVRPYGANPRKNANAIATVARSLKEFGFRQPIVVDRAGVVIVGHTRLEAARAIGLIEVPVHVATELSAEQARAYRLMDNRSADNAEWDEALLAIELTDLAAAGWDLDLTGFDSTELDRLLATVETDRDPDVTPALPAEVRSRRGDIWVCGSHRVMCGDSTSASDVAQLMAGVQADFCFTSPPYAQQRAYKSGTGFDWDRLMQGVFGVLPVKHDAQVLVNLGLVHQDCEWTPYWQAWIDWMRVAGWRRFGWYVWDQGPGLPGDWNGRLAPAFEFVFHFNRVAEKARKTKVSRHAGTANHGTGLRQSDGTVGAYTDIHKAVQAHKIPDSVIRVMRHKARGIECEHPAVFPVALVTEMMTAFSTRGDVCYEPFCGSGTQVIGAELNGRQARAMEIAPEYVDLAVLRWQNHCGKQARREADGLSFDSTPAQSAAA